MELHAQEHARSPQRCPYCHDELRDTEAAARCSKCETAYHEACAGELPCCAVMGCGGELRETATDFARVLARPDARAVFKKRAVAAVALVPLAWLTAITFRAGMGTQATAARSRSGSAAWCSRA